MLNFYYSTRVNRPAKVGDGIPGRFKSNKFIRSGEKRWLVIILCLVLIFPATQGLVAGNAWADDGSNLLDKVIEWSDGSGEHIQVGDDAFFCPLSQSTAPEQAVALAGEKTEAEALPTYVPNDTYFDNQWAISTIIAPQAWQITSGDASVVIAVLDTGIAQGHEDLAGKVIAEINFADSPTTYDIYGHGTHVAGIIAAAANNGLGIAGLAYNCRLMNVKVADESGRCDSSNVAKGIIWAVEHGAKVINMSLFTTEPSSALEEAIDYAWSNGVVVVGAAGNYIGARLAYPAYYSNCLAVAATDASDSVVSWSSHGDWVDVAAPGVSIYSTLPGNEYNYKSGTSMATAYVSGVAGLLFTVVSDDNGNGFVNDEVRVAIENSCDEVGIRGTGKGRINAFEAVAHPLSSK